MIALLFFAFISGLVTILAPCIWPLLPIVLSSTTSAGKSKPLGITLGIITSFAFFTLTISYIVKIIPFDPNILRLFAVLVIGFLGLTLVVPKLTQIIEGWVSRFSARYNFASGFSNPKNKGFRGGLITGLALGVVWSPCAGPILATIATLAATQSVNLGIILVTIVYVVGVGIPLFFFATIGSKFFTKSRALSPYTGQIQKIFGIIMIFTALAIFTNYDKVIQVRLLNAFPSYSNFLLELENNPTVKQQLDLLKGKKQILPKKGPMNKNIIMLSPSFSLPDFGPAPEFVGIAKWLNLPAQAGTEKSLTMQELQGKVVLVDFWTYTCINCIRTLPFVTSWYEKYKDKGFVVIGVHTPEFEFEKNTANVLGAMKQYNINYPVAQDNDYKTWRAYDNHYWPAKYLVDAKGSIRYTHFGEGKYEEIEMHIKTLLKEAGEKVDTKTVGLKDEAPKIRMTPETYLGSSRRTPGAFALVGNWDVQDEYSSSTKGSILEINFYANKVFLVITPKTPNDKIKVFLGGKEINESSAGKDVKNGYIQFNADHPNDLYNLIDLKGNPGDHLLQLEFETEGTKIFAFTFG